MKTVVMRIACRQLLARHLRELDSVVIVAHDRERSAAGHSMTLHRPLLIEEIKE